MGEADEEECLSESGLVVGSGWLGFFWGGDGAQTVAAGCGFTGDDATSAQGGALKLAWAGYWQDTVDGLKRDHGLRYGHEVFDVLRIKMRSQWLDRRRRRRRGERPGKEGGEKRQVKSVLKEKFHRGNGANNCQCE